MRSSWLVAVFALGGCLAPKASECAGGGVCPEGLVCAELDGNQICVLPTCGNNRLDFGEACDDGNNVSGDGCPADCSAPCGDGNLDPGEACDDGNTASGDGCSADCRSNERCGDGVLDKGEACDDGNLRSHDGCSSSCVVETPAWAAVGAVPTARVGHALVYDAARGALVMFGGCTAYDPIGCSHALNDTWTWDGKRWHEQKPTNIPFARFGHAMAYDARRKRVVLFGGCPSNGPCGPSLNDTWEWDGASWERRISVTSPSARVDHAMAYDAVRGRVVLFGGSDMGDGSARFSDTWEWDGTSWIDRTQAASPPGRAQHALAYDAKRGKVVLFGGQDLSGPLSDTWEWNGTTWLARTSSQTPPARALHSLAFDAVRGTTVLVDGCIALEHMPGRPRCLTPIDDQWEWDGSEWRDRTPGARPSARSSHGLAYDAARDKLVVFGGDNVMAMSSDTWEWDSAGWREPLPFGPSARIEHAMTYDVVRAKVVMFGGEGLDDTWEWDGAWRERIVTTRPSPRRGHSLTYDVDVVRSVLFGGSGMTGNLNDTWTWDGTDWVEQHPTTVPEPRFFHGAAYDAARKRLVMFGGLAGAPMGLHASNETWEWDGTNWISRSSATRPGARWFPGMAYDASRQKVVMFGGVAEGGGDLADVWEWDGTDWVERTPATGPMPRSEHAMTYDPQRGVVVLHGGAATGAGAVALDDTWEWNGTTWNQLTPATTPGAQMVSAMAYDTAREQMVLFGGSNYTNETWTLRFDAAGLDERCDAGVDADHDQRIGCADPDCAGRCDPLCESLALCSDTTRERCGDGVCTDLEGCGLCPEDCGTCPLVCGDFQCDAGETCASCPSDCPCP